MPTLFDILVRHQIYLEGLKAGRSNDFPAVLAKLDQALRANLAQVDYEVLGDATKTQLNKLLVALRESMRSIFNPWLIDLVNWLQRFVNVEADAFAEYYGVEDVSGDALFAASKTEPMGANGMFWVPFLNGSASYNMIRIERLVVNGYANRLTKEQIVKSLIGTKSARYRDGIGRLLDGANKAAIGTVIQHLSAQTNAAVAKKTPAAPGGARRRNGGRSARGVGGGSRTGRGPGGRGNRSGFGEYEWVSVLDSGTTEICRDRDGNIYEYGRGPLPPAHVGCRSITVPVYDREPTPELSFGMWAKGQSKAFINDAFDGGVPSRYEGSAALSLAEYKGKRRFIVD